MPLIREYLEHSCDVGRQPHLLKKDFPNHDFSHINKYWWNNDIPINEKKINQETIHELDKRVEKFKNWLKKREEKTIAVICHGTFISRIIHFFLNNCEFEIWHLKNVK